jgi:hypothetical protein
LLITSFNRKKAFFIPVLVFIILALIGLKVLSDHGWDPRAFILERPKDALPSQKGGIGYDGQMSYAIATNPWGSVDGLDQPAFRYQRILYPLLARLLSLGQPALVPWMMLLINLAASVMGCLALARLLVRRNASPWLALVFIFSLGYLLSIRMDLNEPLALCLALWGWLVYEEDRPALAIVLFALSGLTKEIGLVFPLALALSEALQKHWQRSLALLVGSLAPYLIWYLFLYHWLGISKEQIEQSRLILIPFWGLRYLQDPISQVFIGIWVLLPAVMSGVAALFDLGRGWNTERSRDALLVLAQVALLATLPRLTWEDPLAILRVSLGLLAAVLIWLAGSHPRWLPYAAGLWAPSGLVLFFVPNML